MSNRRAGIVRRLWLRRPVVSSFGAVSIICVTCNFITFNVLIARFQAPSVVASLSGCAFDSFVFLGFVFREEIERGPAAGIGRIVVLLEWIPVFFIAMLVTASCVAIGEYALGFRTLLEANIAQFIGQGLGSILRYFHRAMLAFIVEDDELLLGRQRPAPRPVLSAENSPPSGKINETQQAECRDQAAGY